MQLERDASHPAQVVRNFEQFKDEYDIFFFGVPDRTVCDRLVNILKARGYILNHYKIRIIALEQVEESYGTL